MWLLLLKTTNTVNCAISWLFQFLYFVYTFTTFNAHSNYLPLVVVYLFQTYSVEWKRQAFFTFVEVFHDAAYPQDLKAKVKLIPTIMMLFGRETPNVFSGC